MEKASTAVQERSCAAGGWWSGLGGEWEKSEGLGLGVGGKNLFFFRLGDVFSDFSYRMFYVTCG